MKLVAALWDPDPEALFDDELHDLLADAGATRLQVNLDDLPAGVLRLQAFGERVVCVVSVWGPEICVPLLVPYAGDLAAWEVSERVPLPPPDAPDGTRLDALSQVAFLRRPASLPYDAWLAHWHGPHTQVAMEAQATFGYVQNRVLRPLTDDAPPVDAIVEELFPSAAVHDIHAFYGSGGSQDELDRRLTRLMESVSTMGADHDLDVVPTSRWSFDLG